MPTQMPDHRRTDGARGNRADYRRQWRRRPALRLTCLAAALDVPVEALLAVEAPPPPLDAALALRTRTWAPYRAAPRRRAQLDDPEYLAQVASFPLWLLAQQHREDWVGIVVRATARDPDLLHQAAHGSQPTAPVLPEAWAAWRRWCRHHLQRHADARAREAGAAGADGP